MEHDEAKLEQLVKLLEPFTIHTDQLQTDSQLVLYLFHCEPHLQSTSAKQFAQVLVKSLHEHFACILMATNFDPTPAEACLTDPSVPLCFALLNKEGSTDWGSRVFLYFSKSKSTAMDQQHPRKMPEQ